MTWPCTLPKLRVSHLTQGSRAACSNPWLSQCPLLEAVGAVQCVMMRNASNRDSSISEALTPAHVVNPGQQSTNDPDADGLSPCIVHVLVPWWQHCCGQQAQCPTKAIHSMLDESVEASVYPIHFIVFRASPHKANLRESSCVSAFV